MRYTIDGLEYPTDDADPSPVVVEVVVPSRRRVHRDRDGRVVGGGGIEHGGRTLRLVADADLVDRIRDLRAALLALDEHLLTLDVVRVTGDGASGPDEEAEWRTDMRFPTLAAHALLASELVADAW